VRKVDLIQIVFKRALPLQPQRMEAIAFAPSNIALCKYWGKRDVELNLPVTSSLSVSLPTKGTTVTLTWHEQPRDVILFNGKEMAVETAFAQRLTRFLDLFRPESDWHLHIMIQMNIALAAGLASSASGFAALVLALNELFDWQFDKRALSILARLGSGSAARSLWLGFVEWHRGIGLDGMDSYAEPLSDHWSNLCVGILTISEAEKMMSSRDAMQHTVRTSCLYASWPDKVAQDLQMIKQAIHTRHFSLLGQVAETSALAMHATMLASNPPICYFLPGTVAAMQQVWALRRQGLELYFTQDAGPNLKLLFLEQDRERVRQAFPMVDVIPIFHGAEGSE
jgi:diphosphomevalonate decarboxylase